MKYTIIILCFAFLGCCHVGEHTIFVYNNSNTDLYCRTFLNSENKSFNYYLKRNHVTAIGIVVNDKELNKNPSQKIISVIYFDSIEKINPAVEFDQIKLRNLVVRKYSILELQNLKWHIEYK